MNTTDDELHESVARNWNRAGREAAPSFASSWQAAKQRHANATRRYQRFAVAAAVVAAVIIGLKPTGRTG